MGEISEIDYARRESEKADMKQHADKILQGFDKLTDAHAIRAIWELVQNARDVSDECEITFDFTSGNIIVSHNGKPFTSKSIISLIKQVSSKASGQNEDTVGQFGTGFITTHSFGKKIKLSATIEKQNKKYIHFEDFIIDREAQLSEELSDKLVNQQNSIYKIIENAEEKDDHKETTIFEYIASTQLEKESVIRASKNADYLAPYILVLNKKIKIFTIINDEGTTTFQRIEEKDENGLVETVILKSIEKNAGFDTTITSDEEKKSKIQIYSLKNDEVQIILPLKSLHEAYELDIRVPRLFLFFPLIGSEKFGTNYIIHSKLFSPTEPRDGIFLNSKNDQTRPKVIENKRLIEVASKLIFDFLKTTSEKISNPIVFSKIAFQPSSDDTDLNAYYEELKKEYVEALWQCKVVETDHTDQSRMSPSEVKFLDFSFFSKPEYYIKLYQLVNSLYSNIPKQDIAEQWTKNVLEWEYKGVQFISVEDVATKIHEAKRLTSFDNDLIKHFYEYLLAIGKTDLFDKLMLLPNIDGQLRFKTELKKLQNIENLQIQIAKEFIPEVPKQFLDADFEFELKFEDYSRENLSKDFNSEILKKIKDIEKFSSSELVELAKPLLKLCSIYSNENVISTRRSFTPKVAQMLRQPYAEHFIANAENDKFDYDTQPLRLITKIFLQLVGNYTQTPNWLNQNLTFLDESFELIYNYSSLRDIFETSSIIPNQKYELKVGKDLLVEQAEFTDTVDNDFLKDIYEKTVERIRNKLALPQFAKFISHKNAKASLDMSSKIEEQYKLKGSFDGINEHPFKKDILEIIMRMSNSSNADKAIKDRSRKWENLFAGINEKKAVIMMAKISNPGIKDDLFKIISLEDKAKIQLLSQLAERSDLEALVEAGKVSIETQKRKRTDFEHKKKIGVHIEDLVRNFIGEQVQLTIQIPDEADDTLNVDEHQGGQDIIVLLNGTPIYFIEVKSRWDLDNSVFMSKLQLERACKNPDSYALCSVDMTSFTGDNRYEVKDVIEILGFIRFVDTIGIEVAPLVSNNIAAESNIENVRLTDYKGLIPQSIIKNGKKMEDFIRDLCSLINLQLVDIA